MFTQISKPSLRERVLRSPLVDLLTGPHGVDRYTELVEPTWTLGDTRAKVVAVRRQTPRSVTLTLEPNAAFQAGPALRAGQHVTLSVEVDGRRQTRCYSPANAENDPFIELTIGVHDDGVVSQHLYRNARPGMVVGLAGVGGEFVLPADRPRRILFVSGGSGITPVLSMLRTLTAEGHTGEVAFVHYARNATEACYRDELATLPGVRVLHGYTRSSDPADLVGRFGPEHLAAAMDAPDAVFVCGPPALVEAVQQHCPNVRSESFVPPVFTVPSEASGSRVAFADSGIDVTDDGRSLLEQAEAAGLSPESGCRMGICHTCTRRKTSGAVKNLITGAVSMADEEDVQICVTAPVGDVELAL
ncbi:MAG: stearoyl-CoA 9-desaturase oxidoreductase [Mycobacterium sp.]|jgi:ferredoxin-NADP reductase|nr:stearoyl-CoA 9-desaturase oxidoreductase [Mycobacterium sp.]MDT5198196.1 stearoyl-CoA 9-desaturase oxidoreductase [Mycobacterium sp.]MDT5240321.1 stearoyl-CoA 9-desaturase oxidoreductase [Mycobacterium sp.]MDT5299268.1 stearoyl-CoA 9-desaturase oxidoreductase [Mycobacterium sp.]